MFVSFIIEQLFDNKEATTMSERDMLINKLIEILKGLPMDRLRLAYTAIREMNKKNPE
jgi:hypothetical protein